MNSRRRYMFRPSIKYAFFGAVKFQELGFLAPFCAWLLLLRCGSLGSSQNMAFFSVFLRWFECWYNCAFLRLFSWFFCAWIAANIAKKSRNKMIRRF